MNEDPILNDDNRENEPAELIDLSLDDASSANVPPTKKKEGVVSFLFDGLEMFVFSVFAILLIFMFAFRLCRVDGDSMRETLHDGENLLINSFAYTPEQGDIIVFHMTKENFQKTVVKRVIATEGQTVKIDFSTQEVWIDGELYADPHANYSYKRLYPLTAEHHYDPATNTFSATVPEGHLFVLGDNRNNSTDSRTDIIGFVDERCVLGKAFMRLSPFTVFKAENESK